MQKQKKIKNIMTNIFEFPHIPYWFSIDQAVRIIKVSFISTKTYSYPPAILVFDEKYNLLGTLSLREILKGLEPKFMRHTDKAQAYISEGAELSVIWDTLFNKESIELAKRQVSEIMVPAKSFVEPDDPITKAAYLMIHHDLPLLPVLEGGGKFVGLVRMTEVFDELMDVILKD